MIDGSLVAAGVLAVGSCALARDRRTGRRVAQLGRESDRTGTISAGRRRREDPPGGRPSVGRGFPERVGATIRRSSGRPAGDRAADRRAGLAALGSAVALPLGLEVAVLVALIGWSVPWWRATRARARWQAEVDAGVADLAELLRVAVTSGATVRSALEVAVAHLRGPLGERLGTSLEDAERGVALADALAQAADDLGPGAAPLLDALAAGERHGAPLDARLARVAEAARHRERIGVERAARRVPVALLFPLVCCTLPAFALLTVVPVVAAALAALEG